MSSFLETVLIVPAMPGHLETLVRFQLEMAFETENLSLDREICTAGVRSVLKDPTRGVYYVALCDSEVLGSLLVTPEWSDWRNKSISWIQSVYILPDFRKRGIFRKLYETLQAQVRADSGSCGLRLYVEKENESAKRVYRKLGMNDQHYDLFEWLK